MVKRHYGIVTQDYQLVHFYDNGEEWELYDRKKDAQELQSVYNDPAYAAIVDLMKEEWQDMRVCYEDNEKYDKLYM